MTASWLYINCAYTTRPYYRVCRISNCNQDDNADNIVVLLQGSKAALSVFPVTSHHETWSPWRPSFFCRGGMLLVAMQALPAVNTPLSRWLPTCPSSPSARTTSSAVTSSEHATSRPATESRHRRARSPATTSWTRQKHPSYRECRLRHVYRQRYVSHSSASSAIA